MNSNIYTVSWLGLGVCRVLEKNQSCLIRVPAGLALAVGDRVTLTPYGDEERIGEILARKSLLSRPDPGGSGELLIAANVDRVVIVVSMVAPPLHPRIIDRYLVAIQRGGALPVLYVNKMDLLEEGSEQYWVETSKLNAYSAAQVPIVFGSALNADVSGLMEHLRGGMCAFVGHSGVGKSSIINALVPAQSQKTGEVSEGYGRGTHTTTASSIISIDDETYLMDTPGIRVFGLEGVTADDLKWYFPEFEPFHGKCKYRDCSHMHEPQCAVIQAVEEGAIPENRYEAYCHLFEECG